MGGCYTLCQITVLLVGGLGQSHHRRGSSGKTRPKSIGRLLDTLERTDPAENTVIIFTSDNGGLATAEGSPISNAPLSEGKGWMYEGGTGELLILGNVLTIWLLRSLLRLLPFNTPPQSHAPARLPLQDLRYPGLVSIQIQRCHRPPPTTESDCPQD